MRLAESEDLKVSEMALTGPGASPEAIATRSEVVDEWEVFFHTRGVGSFDLQPNSSPLPGRLLQSMPRESPECQTIEYLQNYGRWPVLRAAGG